MLTGEMEPSISNSMMASLIALRTKLPYSANLKLSVRWCKLLNVMTISTGNGWRNASFFIEETLDPPPLYHALRTPNPPLHHSIHHNNHPTLPNNTTHKHLNRMTEFWGLTENSNQKRPTIIMRTTSV